MQKYHIENIPVFQDNNVIGSISESGLFSLVMKDGHEVRSKKVSDIVEPPYPLISFDTPIERISSLISKENGAVLAKDETGSYHIVTKYDVIQAVGR